jgi:antitoxin (DNA-binding transcriptional repressor) of toxin-antitoxin stability system
MKTLTVTAARSRLGYWLKRANRGEEIAVIIGGNIVALQPVQVTVADYAEREYGMTSKQVDRAATRIIAETRALRTQDVTGQSLDEFLAPAHSRKKRRSEKARRAA